MLLAALTRRRVPVRRATLAVERLEDRWVPDTFRYRPGLGTNGLWSWDGGSNWEKDVGGGVWLRAAAGNYPGAANRTTDTALFDDWSPFNVVNYACTMNATITLRTLKINYLYASRITLEHTLTIKDGSAASAGLIMRSGTATIAGNEDLRACHRNGLRRRPVVIRACIDVSGYPPNGSRKHRFRGERHRLQAGGGSRLAPA